MPSGVTNTTPLDLVYTHGLLSFAKGAGRYTLVTKGPPAIKPIRTLRNLASDIDGVTTDIAGFDVIDENNVEITLTTVNMSLDVFQALNPAGTTVTASGPPVVETITPAAASALIPAASLLADIEVAYRKGKDGLVKLLAPMGLVTDWSFSAPNKDKGQAQLTIRARLDLSAVGATTDDAPYSWEITEPTA